MYVAFCPLLQTCMLTTDGGRGLPWRWPVTKGTVMSVETAGDWTWVRVLSGSICQDDVEEVTCRRTHGELCHFTTQFYSTLYRVFFVSSFPAHKCDSRQPCFSSTGQLFPAKTENLCLLLNLTQMCTTGQPGYCHKKPLPLYNKRALTGCLYFTFLCLCVSDRWSCRHYVFRLSLRPCSVKPSTSVSDDFWQRATDFPNRESAERLSPKKPECASCLERSVNSHFLNQMK